MLDTCSLGCASGKLQIIGIGTVQFETNENAIAVNDALFIPEFVINLLSLTELERKGVVCIFEKGIRLLKLGPSIISKLEDS